MYGLYVAAKRFKFNSWLKMVKDKVRRKTFAAREDLINRISGMAEERGYTLYDMVNEVFELAVKAEDAGVSLRKTVEEHGVLSKVKRTGFILCLENLFYDTVELACAKAKNKALKSWFEAGVWLAKRYSTSGMDDPFEAFREDLEAFTWNAPEFTVERAEGEVSMRIISPRFTEAYTLLYAAFLEGAFEAFGYEIAEKEVARGNIRLKAVREKTD